MNPPSPLPIFLERTARLQKAIALQPVDRIPVTAWLDSFAATYRKVPMSVFTTDLLAANRAMIETVQAFPTLDAIETAVTPPVLMGISFLSRVKLPGRELPEGSLYQVEEIERMSLEDYDRILEQGWPAWNQDYIARRLGYTEAEIGSSIQACGMAGQRLFEAGIPALTSVNYVPPIESIAAARSIGRFMTDLHRVPDKLEAVLDHMEGFYLEMLKGMIRQTRPMTVFVGMSRGSSEFFSPRLFNRFTWPTVVRTVETILDAGSVPNLHFDANWDRDISRFKDLPKGKCIWACDHATDIRKLKAELDGHMCIKGDVPAAMLSVGNPDEVYAYCRKLIQDIGPTGFILSPGCTTPMNCKPENFKAMLAAVDA
ncbi:uroporphyrinogen decarboxylase family protein [Holophaga foetida]|uniref:uroporphyrinogen decarboxylase family protein n=1 Tax=Holophaga foetida TaxID=35839 RepID=UPI0002474D75|nr:uroporphyrinogen decarboxylase family protein [Holophaga foetida]